MNRKEKLNCEHKKTTSIIYDDGDNRFVQKCNSCGAAKDSLGEWFPFIFITQQDIEDSINKP